MPSPWQLKFISFLPPPGVKKLLHDLQKRLYYMCERAFSSVGQSVRLITEWSLVQVQQSPPFSYLGYGDYLQGENKIRAVAQ